MAEDLWALIDSRRAAGLLGVHPSRVRALVERGELRAEKIAGRWLIDQSAAEGLAAAERVAGRSMSAANAWGLLFLASDLPAPWMRADVRSRVRRRIRSNQLKRYVRRLRRRAEVHFYRADARALERVASGHALVLSGVSASEHYSLDLKAPAIVDGYLPREKLAKLVYRYALREVGEPAANLILRVPPFWPFGEQRIAPSVVVAVDLLDSLDPRSKRAGERLIRRIGLR